MAQRPTLLMKTAAPESPDALPQAIETAYDWHGGGGSAMYEFASNGGKFKDDSRKALLSQEVDQCLAYIDTNRAVIDSGQYQEYTEEAREAEESGMTTSGVIEQKLNDLKELATQSQVIKEASKTAADVAGAADTGVLKTFMYNNPALNIQADSIRKTIKGQSDDGSYDPDLGWRLWLCWVDAGAELYATQHSEVWYKLFPHALRESLAREIEPEELNKLSNPTQGQDPAATPAPAPKAAKILVSVEVFRRAIQEAEQLIRHVSGSNSVVEGKLVKIHDELLKLESGSGGNLEFILDDESSPSTAKWARELIRVLAHMRGELVTSLRNRPNPQQQEPAYVAASVKQADVTGDTVRTLVKFIQVNKEKLQQILSTKGPEGLTQALSSVPGGHAAQKIMPALWQWFRGNIDEAAMVGTVEKILTKRANLNATEALHVVTGSLELAGFRPSTITSKTSGVEVAGLHVTPFVLRHMAKVANTYGVNVKLAKTPYNPTGELPDTYPEPNRDEPSELCRTCTNPPVHEVGEVADKANKQASEGTIAGTVTEAESMLTAVQALADKALGQARISGNPNLAASAERLAVKVFEASMAVKTMQADAQGATSQDTLPAGAVLVPITASKPKTPKLLTSLRTAAPVVPPPQPGQPIPPQPGQPVPPAVNAPGQPVVPPATANHPQQPSAPPSPASAPAIAVPAPAPTPVPEPPKQQGPHVVNTNPGTRKGSSVEMLEKGPDASKGDTITNALEYINANGSKLEKFTVQELRNALTAAGYTLPVADSAIKDLLGNKALMALATPVSAFL